MDWVRWMKGIHLLISIALVAVMVVTSFSVLTSIGSPEEQPQKARISAYTSHIPISIADNANFAAKATAEGWPGNGTQSNPYIIQGFEIAISITHGIEIGSGVTKYFTIRNCYIHGSGGVYNGIVLHCSHGKLENNLCLGTQNGISIEGASASGNIITGNNCSNNYDGINVYSSGGNAITNNICDDNTNNGVYLDSSSSNALSNNICSGNNYYGMSLSSSNRNTLSNNTCSNNDDGMDFYISNNNTLSNNTCSNNAWYGISLCESSNSNNVSKNVCSNNGYGIYIWKSSANVVRNNNFSCNTEFGAYLYSSTSKNRLWNNTFYHNNDAGNVFNPSTIQAYDMGTGNFWNNTGNYGNFWRDWQTPDEFAPWGIVDSPYSIGGTASAKDFYPRITMMCRINSPTSASTSNTNWGQTRLIGVAVDDIKVMSVVWANDRGGSETAYMTPQYGGLTVCWQSRGNIILFPGVNVITVTAYDNEGHTATDVLTITLDTTPPTCVITTPTTGSQYFTTASIINLAGTASDASGIASVAWHNVATGASGTATITTGWSVTGIALNPGWNLIFANATDNAGNKFSDGIFVYRDPDAPTVTITDPTSNPTMTTNWHYVILKGTASDNNKVTTVAWSNAHTGESGTMYLTPQWGGSSVTWQTRGRIHLLPGENAITVTAYDNAGNTATDILTVTYTGL